MIANGMFHVGERGRARVSRSPRDIGEVSAASKVRSAVSFRESIESERSTHYHVRGVVGMIRTGRCPIFCPACRFDAEPAASALLPMSKP